MAMSVQTSVTDAPLQGYAGMIDTAAPHHIATVRSAEASAAIPFGKAVVLDPSTPATDRDVTLPTTENDLVFGIVVHGQNFSKSWTDGDGNVHGELSSTGLLPGTIFGVLRKGRILVVAATAVVALTSRLWVRAVAGVGETLGALEDADDSTDMIDCTGQGQWMTTADIGDLAWLDVDFSAEA
jgi:hypothetical protein